MLNRERLEKIAEVYAGPESLRPAPGFRGRYYFSTDTLKWCRDNGTSWQEVGGGSGSGDMLKATYDPNADGVIEPAQLNLSGKEPANANIQAHVTSAHAPSNAQKNSDITKAEIEAKLIGEIASHSHAGGSTPSWYSVLYSNQNDCNPNEIFREWNMLAVAGPTPTAITVSLARAVMFTPPANMTCIKVRLFGVGITANLYKFAIYPVGAGSAKLWDSGTVTTAANTWLNIVTNFALTAGTKYWFCVTTVAVGTTAGFRSMPAPLGTTFWGADAAPVGNRALSIPVFVQFAVSTGVFPATLPAIAAAAYSGGTTGSVPFALLDSVA